MTLILFIVALGIGFGVAAYLGYRSVLRRAKSIERGLKMVPIRIYLPPDGEGQTQPEADPTEAMRRKLAQAETLYSLIAGSSKGGFKSKFYGQGHLSLEVVANDGKIHFFAAVPVALVPVVQQAVVSAYPLAQLEEVEDYNIFNEAGRIQGTVGGELVLKRAATHPIQTYKELERDPLESLLNTMSSLKPGEGAAVQWLIRPAGSHWVKRANRLARSKRTNPRAGEGLHFTSKDFARAAVGKVRDPKHPKATDQILTGVEEAEVVAVEEKAKHPGFETLIRLLASSDRHERAQEILTQMTTAFALYDAPGRNGFKLIQAGNVEGLVTAFIFRFFPPELHGNILNTVELATLFHLPSAQSTPTAQVERQHFREVDGPVNLPSDGLLFGYNVFRGVKKEVRLNVNDRRRHTYIVGQTGTGKSTLLENLAAQDMLNGDGFALIDPHGDMAEKMLSMVPKHRAEDIIYFNPGDTERPLGLNIFEFSEPEQKDFLVQEAINMLYKIYDPGKTGVIGPRFEQWFRNAALTLMSDPAGSTFIEIPLVFTDSNYLKQKFKYVTDQTVIDFWTKEMAQTSDYHKSEMLGWFASKFGAFLQNEMMRNIIGQTKSAFNFRDIMDQKKILIVNLSKGKLGELNANLLGMMLVIKFQAAAMSRANMPEDQRADFCLYVDEFQNFSTDSFATILSEARKYRLNLIVANQFIGQLTEEVKNAVFGNVGSIVSFRTGPEDADFLVKQFSPVFDAHDLVNIPNGRAVMRLMVGGLPSQPFSINALPPLTVSNPELGMAIKQLSAAKFGAPKAQVDAEIMGRMSGQAPPPPPPPAQPVPPPPQPAAEPPVQPTSPAEPATTVQAASETPETSAPPNPAPAASEDTLDIKPKAPVNAPAQAAPEPVQSIPPASQPTPQPAPAAVQPTPTPQSQPTAQVTQAPQSPASSAQPQSAASVQPVTSVQTAPAPAAPQNSPQIRNHPRSQQQPNRAPERRAEARPVHRRERVVPRPTSAPGAQATSQRPAPSPQNRPSQPTRPPVQTQASQPQPIRPVAQTQSPAPTPERQPAGVAASTATQPKPKPGEIYVDANGNVIQG